MNFKIEPLEYYYEKYHFTINNIERISTGRRYTAILLNNGNIGVCANLDHSISPKISNYSNLNLLNFSH